MLRTFGIIACALAVLGLATVGAGRMAVFWFLLSVSEYRDSSGTGLWLVQFVLAWLTSGVAACCGLLTVLLFRRQKGFIPLLLVFCLLGGAIALGLSVLAFGFHSPTWAAGWICLAVFLFGVAWAEKKTRFFRRYCIR